MLMTIGIEKTSSDLADLKVNALEKPWVPLREKIPDIWTPEHVCQRLLDAFETLAKCPKLKGPKMPGNSWPTHLYDFAEVRGWYELTANELAERNDVQNRAKLRPTSRELANMEIAFDWLRQVRAIDEALARVIGLWASTKASRGSLTKLIRHRGWCKQTFYLKRDRAAQLIVDMLKEQRKPVF